MAPTPGFPSGTGAVESTRPPPGLDGLEITLVGSLPNPSKQSRTASHRYSGDWRSHHVSTVPIRQIAEEERAENSACCCRGFPSTPASRRLHPALLSPCRRNCAPAFHIFHAYSRRCIPCENEGKRDDYCRLRYFAPTGERDAATAGPAQHHGGGIQPYPGRSGSVSIPNRTRDLFRHVERALLLQVKPRAP